MLSIVIPTCNPKYIDLVLGALCGQSMSSFEVVIVENGSSDSELAHQIKRFQEQLDLVYLHMSEPGLNRARNVGVRHATYGYIVLLDDDCVPTPRWAESVLQGHKLFPNAGVIGGRVELSFESSPPIWMRGEFRRSLAELDWGEGCRPLGRWEHLVGANLSFTNQIYRRVGGFQNLLGLSRGDQIIRANDEAEFIMQASVAGRPGAVYAADMKISHRIPDERIEFDYMLKRRFGQGVSDIEQELAVLGREAAAERLASIVFRSAWHRDEHLGDTSNLGESNAIDYKIKVMTARMSYLLGARERFLHRHVRPCCLTLSTDGDASAFYRGRRISAGSGKEINAQWVARLERILYLPRAWANPSRIVCFLAGVFHDIMPVEVHECVGSGGTFA